MRRLSNNRAIRQKAELAISAVTLALGQGPIETKNPKQKERASRVQGVRGSCRNSKACLEGLTGVKRRSMMMAVLRIRFSANRRSRQSRDSVYASIKKLFGEYRVEYSFYPLSKNCSV